MCYSGLSPGSDRRLKVWVDRRGGLDTAEQNTHPCSVNTTQDMLRRSRDDLRTMAAEGRIFIRPGRVDLLTWTPWLYPAGLLIIEVWRVRCRSVFVAVPSIARRGSRQRTRTTLEVRVGHSEQRRAHIAVGPRRLPKLPPPTHPGSFGRGGRADAGNY